MELKEFNIYHKTKFTIGLRKSWFAWGEKYKEENVRVEQLNLALDAAAYHMIKCRTCNLTKFTTTNEPTKSCPRMRVETHTTFYMDPANYADEKEPGFKLVERPLRRMREEIRKMFRNLRAMPTWADAMAKGDVKPPVMYIRGKRVAFPIPKQGPTTATKVIYERAKRRVEAYNTPGYDADLPMIAVYDWEKLRISSTDLKVRTEPELISLTSAENQLLETYVSHMTVSRGNFYPTMMVQRKAMTEMPAPTVNPAVIPVPTVVEIPAVKKIVTVEVDKPAKDKDDRQTSRGRRSAGQQVGRGRGDARVRPAGEIRKRCEDYL